MKTEIVEVDLTDETAQNITSDQSLIQEAHEEAKLRAANSAIQEIPQSKIGTSANAQTQNESKNGSQPHIGEPQPSTSGSISNQEIVRKFRLNVLLKVKEGEERKLVEEILRPGDPISLKFSTNDENIRLVMSQSKIENEDLEFWATFELRCDGFEGFDLERVTNHLTINPINCPRIRSKVGIIHLLNQNRIYNLFFTYTDFLNFPF